MGRGTGQIAEQVKVITNSLTLFPTPVDNSDSSSQKKSIRRETSSGSKRNRNNEPRRLNYFIGLSLRMYHLERDNKKSLNIQSIFQGYNTIASSIVPLSGEERMSTITGQS